MSARSWSSTRSRTVRPGFPSRAIRGAWFVEVLKWVLPQPPFPPLRKTQWSVSSVKSRRISPVSASLTRVPGGIGMTASAPSEPCMFRLVPSSPFRAL